MTCVETLKLDLIYDFSYNYYLKLSGSGQFLEFVSSQFITFTMGVLDQ